MKNYRNNPNQGGPSKSEHTWMASKMSTFVPTGLFAREILTLIFVTCSKKPRFELTLPATTKLQELPRRRASHSRSSNNDTA